VNPGTEKTVFLVLRIVQENKWALPSDNSAVVTAMVINRWVVKMKDATPTNMPVYIQLSFIAVAMVPAKELRIASIV